MTILEALSKGNLGLARVIAGGYKPGDTVWINTHTSPRRNDNTHIQKFTIDRVVGDEIHTRESEPYFGYNIFNRTDIVG